MATTSRCVLSNRKTPPYWPVITGQTGSIAVDYGVTAVPESYLVAPSGVVAAKLIGGVTAADLDARIDTLTAQSEAAGQ